VASLAKVWAERLDTIVTSLIRSRDSIISTLGSKLSPSTSCGPGILTSALEEKILLEHELQDETDIETESRRLRDEVC